MSSYVITNGGQKTAQHGKSAGIYKMASFSGLDAPMPPLGILVYRTTSQSIAAGSWANITFQAAQAAPATYGMPVMWSSGADVDILQTGWYLISASLSLTPVGSVAIHAGFRIVQMIGGVTSTPILATRTYIPNQYDYPIAGSIAYRLTAGDAVRLQASHTHSSAVTTQAGMEHTGLSITFLTA